MQEWQREDAQLAAQRAAELEMQAVKLAAQQEALEAELEAKRELQEREWAVQQEMMEREWAMEQEMQEKEWANKLALQMLKQQNASNPQNQKYDNGTLTAQQVLQMQSYYGLPQTGLWTTDNKKETGLKADKAWEQYVSASQYLGTTRPENPSLTSVSFYKDEGVFVWNGTSYRTKKDLLSAIRKADLTQVELSKLEASLERYGFKEKLKE